MKSPEFDLRKRAATLRRMATNDENRMPVKSSGMWACSPPSSAYTTLNPSLFDSADHWSYRDLQKLAKRLEVPASGKRQALVARLQAWHRQRRTTDQSGQFLAVEIRGLEAAGPAPKSPNVPKVQGSPAPILSSSKRSRLALEERSPLRQHTGASVNFSPFNSVKVCRHCTSGPRHTRSVCSLAVEI